MRVSTHVSGFLQGMCGVNEGVFVKTSVRCLIHCCLAWTEDSTYCPLVSHLRSLKTWLFRWFQISVTIGIMVALITTDGCNAASCWLHWPQFGRPSGVLAGWLERLWCMLVGRWHVQPVAWLVRYRLLAGGFQHSHIILSFRGQSLKHMLCKQLMWKLNACILKWLRQWPKCLLIFGLKSLNKWS